jgi:Kef-type K+ transport system membrane component KefB
MESLPVVSTTTIIGQLALLILVAKTFGLLAKKLNVPSVVGELFAGLLLGPSMLGVIASNNFLDKTAEIGVILLMFYAGLETNLKDLKDAGGKAFLIATGGVIFPLIMGTILYMEFNGFASPGTKEFNAAIFLGTVLTATSVSITVQALRDLGKLQGTVGTTIISAAIIDDVLGIIVLTIVSNMAVSSGSGSGANGSAGLKILLTLGKTVLFFILVIGLGVLVNKLFQKIFKNHFETQRVAVYGIALCFGLAWLAERFFGIADITGAYCAGVMLCNLHSKEYIGKKVDSTSYMVFGPIFFCSIGLKTNLSSFNLSMVWFTIALIIVALGTKLIGCGAIAKLSRFSTKDSMRIGLGMMTRGEVALIVAQKAIDTGVLGTQYLAPIILLIVVSAVVTPVALKAAFKGDVASGN